MAPQAVTIQSNIRLTAWLDLKGETLLLMKKLYLSLAVVCSETGPLPTIHTLHKLQKNNEIYNTIGSGGEKR